MVKTKSIEESVENYVGSISVGMLKYKKHLMRDKNFSEADAIDKTLEYGMGMLRSGLGGTITPQRAAALFREQADINTALANICEKEEHS
ncbi:MAG: hypothetical protein KGI27_03130 [Thaumarchaeota archaeon]|nr:hypothetical protein [Nitrososphaerota archaeon]